MVFEVNMLPKLLQEVVDGLSAEPVVEAILLAGSRGKSGSIDAASDYDLYVYCHKELDYSLRQKILEPRSRLLELNNRFWETEDDGILNDGTAFELIYRSLDWLEAHLKSLVDSFQVQTGYSTCLWGNLLNSRILFDRNGRAGKLQDRFTREYPEGLRKAVVEKNWPLLMDSSASYFHQVEKALKRDDWVSIQHRTAAFLASYFDILYAVNSQTHPGEKRLQTLAEKLGLVPRDFSLNLKNLRAHSGSDNLWILSDLEHLARNLGQLLVNEGLLAPSNGQTSAKDPALHPDPVSDVPGPTAGKPLVVYTDGGCIGNPGKGAWAFIVVDGQEECEGTGGEPMTTNNKMELQAVIQALEKLKLEGKTGRSVTIHTDSQYVKNGINEWIHTWEKNGWKTAAKEPVKNKELWQALQVLQKALNPQWKWVKGHAGNPLNERCDRLVRRTMDSL